MAPHDAGEQDGKLAPLRGEDARERADPPVHDYAAARHGEEGKIETKIRRYINIYRYVDRSKDDRWIDQSID